MAAVALGGTAMLPPAAAAIAADNPAAVADTPAAVADTPAAVADTFHATVTGASGRFAGNHGTATIVLHRGPGSRSAQISVTISFHGVSCHSARRCLQLDGRLTGQMTPQHSLADVGHSYALTAAGALAPLGHVSTSGTATGTGFIRTGHTKLAVTLHAGAGTVTLSGQSGAVPAFTNP